MSNKLNKTSSKKHIRTHTSDCSPKCKRSPSSAPKCKPIPDCLPKCKPEYIPITLEIAPIITLVVDKPTLHVLNNANCKPSKKCHKSRSRYHSSSHSSSHSRSRSLKKCECGYKYSYN